MAALTPEQQAEFIAEDPKTFLPEAGAWGRMGCTRILLASADADAVGRALTLARQNTLNKASAAVRRKRPARG